MNNLDAVVVITNSENRITERDLDQRSYCSSKNKRPDFGKFSRCLSRLCSLSFSYRYLAFCHSLLQTERLWSLENWTSLEQSPHILLFCAQWAPWHPAWQSKITFPQLLRVSIHLIKKNILDSINVASEHSNILLLEKGTEKQIRSFFFLWL